jgi:polyhydroxybutyrate depolymerase
MAKDMIVRGRGESVVRRRGGPTAGPIDSGERTRRAMVWLALVLTPLAAAPEQAAAASGRVSIQSGGITRTAVLIEHRRLKQARRSLIIVLRGDHAKGQRLKRNFAFQEMVGSAGSVLVYPDPVGGHWSAGPGADAGRDATFIRDLIAKFVTDKIVDRRKVFVVGISSGGFAALRSVCDDASAFAGAGMLFTAMPADLAAACKPARPVPLIIVVGDQPAPNAGAANPSGGQTNVLSADATLAIFAKAAGCGESRAAAPPPSREAHDGPRVHIDRLSGCKVPVEILRVEGGGHPLPGHVGGGGETRGPRAKDFEPARAVWDFFRRLGA